MPDPGFPSRIPFPMFASNEDDPDDKAKMAQILYKQTFGPYGAGLFGVRRAPDPKLHVSFETVQQWLLDHGWFIHGVVDGGGAKTLVIEEMAEPVSLAYACKRDNPNDY